MDQYRTEPDYKEWIAVKVYTGERLDVALTEKTGKSRNYIQNLIGEERVLVNGQVKKANYKVQKTDIIEIN